MTVKAETRGELTDTVPDVVLKMTGGNPGALRVCMEVMQEGEKIDPDSALGGLGTLLTLDTCKIYEHRIWMLYKDVCSEDLVKMFAVMRSWQLGFLSQDKLDHAIDNYGDGIDVDELEQQVRARLPAFGKQEKIEEEVNG